MSLNLELAFILPSNTFINSIFGRVLTSFYSVQQKKSPIKHKAKTRSQ